MDTNPTLSGQLDFTHEAPAEEASLSAAGVRRIIEVFEQMYYIDKLHPAAQLVVLHNGHVVVDRAIGGARFGPVTPETSFLTFSCSKALTGMCVHKLIEDGLVDIDAPISKYWPAWGSCGKETATIRHAFLHQAGVPKPHINRQVLLWPSWSLVTWELAHTRAMYPPGSQTSYHMVNFGFILGKVIESASSMSFPAYLRQAILDPLGMKHSYLPLPKRMLRRTPLQFTTSPEQRNAAWVFNLPAIRTAVIPAATLHSNARGLATFYQMLINGGIYAGKQIYMPETIAFATSPGYLGYDGTFKEEARWAYGFHLGGPETDNEGKPRRSGMGLQSTLRTFGHFGIATCMGWADPDSRLVVAFTTNGMQSGKLSANRCADLSDAVWQSLEN